MVECRHLRNAPITEAVINLRVRPSPCFQVTEFSSLIQRLHDRYPIHDERRLFEAGFGVEKGKAMVKMPEDKGINGYIFKSEDNRKVAQFNKGEFTFSLLKPYTNWEDILGEAKHLWNIYKETAAPEQVYRIAVRYINHIKILLPINDFAEYLTVPPRVPDNVPQALGAFFSRITVHDEEQDIAANIIQAIEKSPDQNYIAIILDIDAHKRKEFSTDSEDIWQTLMQLRTLKNQIFFGSITDKTVRLFE